MEWAAARVVRDDPAKTLDTTGRTDVLLLSTLLPDMGTPKSSFDLVSPYFVPGDGGTDGAWRPCTSGVKVRVLTNALAATDVAPCTQAMRSAAATLLRAGVDLYELKPSASVEGIEPKSKIGSSASTQLHAKTFAVDRSRIFVARSTSTSGPPISTPRWGSSSTARSSRNGFRTRSTATSRIPRTDRASPQMDAVRFGSSVPRRAKSSTTSSRKRPRGNVR